MKNLTFIIAILFVSVSYNVQAQTAKQVQNVLSVNKEYQKENNEILTQLKEFKTDLTASDTLILSDFHTSKKEVANKILLLQIELRNDPKSKEILSNLFELARQQRYLVCEENDYLKTF